MLRYKQIKERLRFCDSYNRLPTLLDVLEEQHSVEDWLKVLGEKWSSCDNIGLYYDPLYEQLAEAFDYQGGAIPELMTKNEWTAYTNLPDEVTVYRGCYWFNKCGFSWSLDKQIAVNFPTLNRYRVKDHEPILLTGKISKEEVLAVKLCRDESELILLDWPNDVKEQFIK